MEIFIPFSSILHHIHAEHVLQYRINPINFSIYFWAICCTKLDLGTQSGKEGIPKCRCKLHIPTKDYYSRYPTKLEYFTHKYVCNLNTMVCWLNTDKLSYFAQFNHHYHNQIFFFLDLGKHVIKSSVMVFHFHSGTGREWSSPTECWCYMNLDRYSMISLPICGRAIFLFNCRE